MVATTPREGTNKLTRRRGLALHDGDCSAQYVDASAHSAAIDSGDRRVIAAVLGAPPFLLGIDQKTHDILKTTAINIYCGEKQDALDALNADIDRVQRARDSFFERMTTSIRSWHSEEQQIIKEALA